METKLGSKIKSLLEENNYVDTEGEKVVDLPLDEIKPNPYQPRYVFNDEKIEELAQSIKNHGVFQPIIVKKMNGYYSIIAGERRYRACKKLGLKSIPAIIRMYEKSKMIEIALIENLQRENLTPIEEAKAYQQIMREFDYTQAKIGEVVGKSRSHVTNTLGLLNLPDDILELVDSGKISMGHARVLSKLEDVDKIRFLAKEIIDKNLSVRDIEALASVEKKKVAVVHHNETPSYYKEYENSFKNIYNGKIKLSNNKIVINASNEDELKKILDKLTKE